MSELLNHPGLLALLCLVALWAVAVLGAWIRVRLRASRETDQEDLSLVVSAALTLLGLVIGFTFSMATNRYDQRRLYEEEEANAIGTEYVRADLLPGPEREAVRHLLVRYLDSRIGYFESGYGGRLDRVDEASAALQERLWQAVQPAAAAAPTPVTALAISGMNDVLNTQGYTQFAWWNRIPDAAWALMVMIALLSNGLVGYATRRSRSGNLLLLVLPVLVSVSFFLVADIDSPRGGIIRVEPVDLISLSHSLHRQTP
jgi:hypothetical protein